MQIFCKLPIDLDFFKKRKNFYRLKKLPNLNQLSAAVEEIKALFKYYSKMGCKST